MDVSAELSPLLAVALTAGAAAVGVVARVALAPLIRSVPRVEWGVTFALALVLGALVCLPIALGVDPDGRLASDLGACTLAYAGASAAVVLLRAHSRRSGTFVFAGMHALNAIIGSIFGAALIVLIPRISG